MSEMAALWSHAGCNTCRVQPLRGASHAHALFRVTRMMAIW